MMTTMAAMFGALPLALGGGTGAELRRPLGITIVGGLIVSQALTLFTTPVVYLYMDRLQTWLRPAARARSVLPIYHEPLFFPLQYLPKSRISVLGRNLAFSKAISLTVQMEK